MNIQIANYYLNLLNLDTSKKADYKNKAVAHLKIAVPQSEKVKLSLGEGEKKLIEEAKINLDVLQSFPSAKGNTLRTASDIPDPLENKLSSSSKPKG